MRTFCLLLATAVLLALVIPSCHAITYEKCEWDCKRPELRGNPSGRPSVMYEFPSLYGARSNQTDIISGELENQEDLVLMRTSVPADDDMFQICCHTVAEP
uniref:Secreted protein n=1 Tax=Capitella teleta TaxID=283909 RepID=X2A7L6_CAPTE